MTQQYMKQQRFILVVFVLFANTVFAQVGSEEVESSCTLRTNHF